TPDTRKRWLGSDERCPIADSRWRPRSRWTIFSACPACYAGMARGHPSLSRPAETAPLARARMRSSRHPRCLDSFRWAPPTLYPILRVHRPIHGFRTLQVSQLRVRTPEPMDVTLDGEIAGKIPGNFEVVPAGLRVITSPSFKDKHRSARGPSRL